MKKKPNKVSKETKQDIKDAASYYGEINKDLAKKFVKENRELLDRIADAPEQFPKIYKEVRRALLKKFPYMVLFVMQPFENIVIGVFHQNSNPKTWQNRSEESETY